MYVYHLFTLQIQLFVDLYSSWIYLIYCSPDVKQQLILLDLFYISVVETT